MTNWSSETDKSRPASLGNKEKLSLCLRTTGNHKVNQCDFAADLQFPDTKRVRMIEELSKVQKKDIIRCPTPPPTLQVKEGLSKSFIGNFAVLPLELLHTIFHFSALESLSLLRRTNRRTRFLLDQWPVYSTLLEHVPKALLIFARTGAASYFTAKQVRDVLYTSECSVCGLFGSYLYLPQCKRCCFRCLECDMQLATITNTEALHWHGKILSNETLAGMRFVSTVTAWTYKKGLEPSKTPLFSLQDVYHEVIVKEGATRDSVQWLILTGQKHHDARGLAPSHGTARQVSLLFPYLNRNTTTCEYGLSCRGCEIRRKSEVQAQSKMEDCSVELARGLRIWIWGTEYSKEGFIEHLKNCENSRGIEDLL